MSLLFIMSHRVLMVMFVPTAPFEINILSNFRCNNVNQLITVKIILIYIYVLVANVHGERLLTIVRS